MSVRRSDWRRVVPSPRDLQLSWDVAVLIQSRGHAGRYGSSGDDPDDFEKDLIGHRSEAAFSTFLGIPYQPNDRWQRPGVPDVHGFQVRGTKLLGGGLILHGPDPDEAPFVLVYAERPDWFVFWIAGWIRKCGEAKTDDRVKPLNPKRPPAYVVWPSDPLMLPADMLLAGETEGLAG